MSRTVPPGGSAQIQRRCSSDWILVQVENDVGAMVTHAPYKVEYEDPRADAPIGAITLTFRRGEGINSLAPLMTVNPPIDVGRLMTLAIDAGDGTWTEVFRGYADRVAWPKKEGGDVTVEGRDLAGRVMDTFIEEERAYGSEAGTPLEDVIQAVGDDNLEDPLTVHVAAPTGAVVVSPPEYVPSDVATFEAMQHLAESVGDAIRMRYIDGTGWALSLFEPARTKTVPDRTFTGSLYYDVSRMEQDNADIFNVVEVEYSDEDEVRQRVEVEDAASIARYGRRYMRINEASDSIIRDSTTATALANAALSDLAEPDATLEIQCAYFWAGEVGIDLYRFEANGVHFSSDQDLAAVAIKHRLVLNERPESWITVRGKPSAGVLLWEKKARQPKVSEPASIYQIRNLNVQHNSDGTSTVTWELGARISETWGAYQIVTAPETPAKWDAVRADVLPVTSPWIVTTPVETAGVQQLGLLRLEGRYTDAATGDRLTGDAYEHTVFPKTSIPAIDDDTGEIATGAISLAEQFAATIKPVHFIDSLAGAGEYDGQVAVLTTDGKLYRWIEATTEWVPVVRAVDIDGDIIADEVAAGAIEIASFAAGIEPVTISTAGTLPTVKTTEALYWSGKLYRWDGAAYTAAVPTVDLTGTIAETQVATGAITETKIAADAVTSPKILAGAVTTAKLDALAVTAEKIAALAVEAGKIAADAVTAGTIAAGAVAADEIAANAITTDKLFAGAVTTEKIAALAVTTAELAALAVTADKIAANAITAAKIEADAVTAAAIAAGAVVAEAIDAGAVTADKIAANAVSAGKIDISNAFTTATDITPLIVGDYTNDHQVRVFENAVHVSHLDGGGDPQPITVGLAQWGGVGAAMLDGVVLSDGDLFLLANGGQISAQSDLRADAAFHHTAGNLGFFGATGTSTLPVVSGSKGGNFALASLIAALSSLGLIDDTTT